MSENSQSKSEKSASKDELKGTFEDFAENSSLYREFLAEREEIMKHKWIESEKEGKDIGFERALLDWIRNHREEWRKTRSRNQ